MSFYELEIEYKKTISKEVLIGIVCGSASAFFAIVGIIILIKNRDNLSEISEIWEDSSEIDNQEIFQADIQINDNKFEKLIRDDEWL